MDILSGSGYTLEAGEPNGIIRATRETPYPSPVAVMHLQIHRDKEAITVSVHSSNLSVLFGNFWHNATDEENFVEQVLISLHEAEKRNRTAQTFGEKMTMQAYVMH